MDDLTNFFMILMLMILEKDHQDKVWEFHKHYNHLKFVKSSIYRPSKNIGQEYLTLCFDFLPVSDDFFFCFFTMKITFDVVILTSEAMRFQAESLVIVKNRICCFNFKLKTFFFRFISTLDFFDGVFWFFVCLHGTHGKATADVSWYVLLAARQTQLRAWTALFSFM